VKIDRPRDLCWRCKGFATFSRGTFGWVRFHCQGCGVRWTDRIGWAEFSALVETSKGRGTMRPGRQTGEFGPAGTSPPDPGIVK